MVQDVGATASAVMTTSGDTVYYGSGGRTRLPKGTDGQVMKLASGLPSWAAASGVALDGTNTWSGAQTFTNATGGGKWEKLGEHAEASEETSFTFTPAADIDMSDYSAIVCYYSYGVAYSGVTAFDVELQLDNNSAGNYHSLGYTQDTTTLTGFQTVAGTSFVITDTNQNTNGSPKNYGTFVITADSDGTYYNIQSWSNGWNRDTRTMFGEKVATLGDISTLDFDSSEADGWLTSLWQFYGVRR